MCNVHWKTGRNLRRPSKLLLPFPPRCEHGILERCTSTSNTKCKEKRNHLLIFFNIPIIMSEQKRIGLLLIKRTELHFILKAA